jgi:hypothetical protein
VTVTEATGSVSQSGVVTMRPRRVTGNFALEFDDSGHLLRALAVERGPSDPQPFVKTGELAWTVARPAIHPRDSHTGFGWGFACGAGFLLLTQGAVYFLDRLARSATRRMVDPVSLGYRYSVESTGGLSPAAMRMLKPKRRRRG